MAEIICKPHTIPQHTAQLLSDLLTDIATSQNTILFGIAGGQSIQQVLPHLKHHSVPWECIHLFLIDERMVPLNHPDSNYRLIRECLSPFVSPLHLHAFPTESSGLSHAVEQYNRELKEYGSAFDIVLASAGKDGHIASLFPQHPSIDDPSPGFIAVTHAPKPPPTRMSISKQLLQQTKKGMLLFCGQHKINAFNRFLDADIDEYQCPTKLIKHIAQSYVLTDIVSKKTII